MLSTSFGSIDDGLNSVSLNTSWLVSSLSLAPPHSKSTITLHHSFLLHPLKIGTGTEVECGTVHMAEFGQGYLTDFLFFLLNTFTVLTIQKSQSSWWFCSSRQTIGIPKLSNLQVPLVPWRKLSLQYLQIKWGTYCLS